MIREPYDGPPSGSRPVIADASNAAATASNSASAPLRPSTISRAMTSGGGRLSRSSSDASFSQVISRLALSRATSSS